MRKNILMIILVFITGLLYAADPVVENVRMEQRTDGSLIADIYYDVTDSDGDTLSVIVKASDDNGATWSIPCTALSGDVGSNVLSGTGRHIVWDFYADNPDVNGDGYRVKVTASDVKAPEMVYVEGGTFDMGSADGDADEQPVHSVSLGSFYIDKYEVTNAHFAAFLNAVLTDGLITVDNSVVKKDTLELLNLDAADCQIAYQNGLFVTDDGKDEYPVIHVTWHGANAYAEYYGKRLPTEAEWEYAARGASKGQGYSYSGGNEMDPVGWYKNNSNGSTQPVGQKLANEMGLHDMSGNVWEWCADKYDRKYYGASPASNPYGSASHSKTTHVLRGGAWDDVKVKSKVANRNRDQQWLSYNNRGFRCVKGDTNFTVMNSISVSPQSKTIPNGSSFQFICNAHYSDGSSKEITAFVSWTIVSGNVGSIDNTGLYTVSENDSGEVTIRAEYDGFSAESNVKVIKRYGIMTDKDGNVYKIVKIGDQWWMAENLKVLHYRNGDPISNVTDTNEWANLSTGAYCYYNNDNNNGDVYGALYNWFAVTDVRNIAPEGWHVPTNAEWTELENYLGGRDVAGGKLKKEGTNYWNSPNTGATNESGFTALPGGYCSKLETSFMEMGNYAYFWSSSQYNSIKGLRRNLNNESSASDSLESHKQNGFSIRLVRDNDGNNTPPAVTFPNGGESLNVWDKHIIKWENNSIDDRVYIDLYKGNEFVERLKDTGTTNDGDFTWIVSTDLVTGSDYRIKITGLETGLSDFSDGYFSIINNGLNFETGTVTDIDGNIYRTVKIGNQWWMADNLNVTHYRNGDPIPNVTGDEAWVAEQDGAYCYYNNDRNNADIYGALYNWHAVKDERNIAPEGWHVPTDEEWKQLEMYLGMSQAEADFLGGRGSDEGGKLKETGTDYWNSPNTGATNETGFSALPGGSRYALGYFGDINRAAYFWTVTPVGSSVHHAYVRILHYDNSYVVYTSTGKSSYIRCIKD